MDSYSFSQFCRLLPCFLSVFVFSLSVEGVEIEIEDVQGRVITVKVLEVYGNSVQILHENGREYEIGKDRLTEQSWRRVEEVAKSLKREGPLLTRENRLRVAVALNKRDKLDLRENYDDRVVFFLPKVKVTNRDIKTGYSGVKCTLAVIGRSVTEKDIFKVLSKQDFALDLPSDGFAEWDGAGFRARYDDENSARFGFKLDGYIIVLRNARNDIVYAFASSKTWLEPEHKIFTLEEHREYDRKLSRLMR